MNRTTEQDTPAFSPAISLVAADEAQLDLPLAVDNPTMNPQIESSPADSAVADVSLAAESQETQLQREAPVTADVFAVEPYVHEPILGQRLRAAREARSWTVADVSARLHLPSTVVNALESGNYSRIGNGVYLRGYMLSYLRLLALPVTLLETLVEQVEPEPPLVTTGAVSHPRYLYNRYSVPTIYLILTGLIVVPAVWLTTHGGLEQTLVRIAPLDTPAEISSLNLTNDPNSAEKPSRAQTPANEGDSAAAAMANAGSTPTATPANSETPLIASFTPYMNAKTAAPQVASAAVGKETGAHHVRLTLTEESWVEILGAEGKRLDYGLLPAGTQHEYFSDGALDIRIGNSNGATLEVDGRTMDLTPYRHSNVARLKLFSEADKASHSDS